MARNLVQHLPFWITDANRASTLARQGVRFTPDESFRTLERQMPEIYKDYIDLDYDTNVLHENIEYNSFHDLWEKIELLSNSFNSLNPFATPLDIFDFSSDGNRHMPIFKTFDTWLKEFKDLYRDLNGKEWPNNKLYLNSLKLFYNTARAKFKEFKRARNVRDPEFMNWMSYITKIDGDFDFEWRLLIAVPLLSPESFAALPQSFNSLYQKITEVGYTANNSFKILGVTFTIYEWALQSNLSLQLTTLLEKQVVAESPVLDRLGGVAWLAHFCDIYYNDDPTMSVDDLAIRLTQLNLFNHRMYVSNNRLFDLFEQIHDRFNKRRTHTFALIISFHCLANRQWQPEPVAQQQEEDVEPDDQPNRSRTRTRAPAPRRSTRIALNLLQLPPRQRRAPRRYSPSFSPPRTRSAPRKQKKKTAAARSKTTPGRLRR